MVLKREPSSVIQRQAADQNRNALYFGGFLPFISGLFMAVIPDWSLRFGKAVLAILILNSLFILIMKMTKFVEKSRKRKVIFGISQFQLFVIFLFGVIWRLWDGGFWLAALLFLVNAAAAYVGYRYRQVIFQEVIHPKTKAGRIIFAVGLIGGGAAGAVGYILSRVLSDTFPDLVPLYATLAFVPVSIYIVLVIYSGWIKAEQPDWEPDRRTSRNKSRKRKV